MFEVYDQWPQMAKDSYNSDLKEIDFTGIDHLVFAGMGGSGAIGSIFSSILSKTNIHVSLVKGYVLPRTVDSETLVITTSVSGNTVETLTVLDSANKLDCKIVACSSGGKIEDYCIKNKIEFRKISQIHSPRASFPKFLYSMLKVLDPIIPITSQEVNDSIIDLKKISKKISSKNISTENPALYLAEWIKGIPLIYYPAGLQAAAIRFKNSLQENSKTHAMIEDVVETCHNGIVSWEQPSNVIPILIQGNDDSIKTKERWKMLKEYFQIKNIEYKDVYSIKGSILTKLIGLTYYLDYSTIYRSVLSEINPTPTKSIDYIKEKLKTKL